MMNLKTLVLGSACLSLGAAVASAQDHPQSSTPVERAQTQQLNTEATQGTTASPSELNAEPGSSQQMAQSEPAQYDDQQQRYQQQQQQYQDQQQRYQEQRAQNRPARQQYVSDVQGYDVQRYEWTDYPQVYVYRYEGPELRRLYLLADPTHQLANAPIEAPSGRFIGKVRNVETAPDGRPRRIEVALNRMVSVWVSPNHFRFDADDHVLFTDLRREDLWQMPGATITSGDVYRP